jgi:hypothetical protein
MAVSAVQDSPKTPSGATTHSSMGSVERRTRSHRLAGAPTSPSSGNSLSPAVLPAEPVVEAPHVAPGKGNVVEAEVPDAGVHHPVCAQSEHGADDGAGKNVVPVVILVDREGASDQGGAEDLGVESGELPHVRRIVGEDLELGVEVQVQEDETRDLRRVSFDGPQSERSATNTYRQQWNGRTGRTRESR